MANPTFYVYQYLTSDGVPYYIGKGSKNRINESHAPWVEIPSEEFRQFVQINMEEKDAFDLEIKLIKQYGRKIDGGILDNIKLTRWVAQAGWKHSDTAKQKISKKNLGKIRTAEHRNNYKGCKTAEHADNIRQAVKKLWEDPVYKAQRLEKIEATPFAHKGKPWSPARREAQMKRKQSKGLDV
jgi:hypothetical protein